MTTRHHTSLDRVGPDLPPPCDPFAGGRPPGPRDRVEELIGADLTRLLLSALAGGYRARPDRGRGRSSP